MNRRDFFKKAIQAAGAVAVLPLVSPSTTMAALQPIIEYAQPMDGFPDLTLAEVVERSIQACDRNEAQWPGFTRALYKALDARLFGPAPLGRPCAYANEAPLTLQDIADSWLRNLDCVEREHPGSLRLIYEALTPRMVGLSVPDFYSALWRTEAHISLDGWTHHAMAVSEGVHP